MFRLCFSSLPLVPLWRYVH